MHVDQKSHESPVPYDRSGLVRSPGISHVLAFLMSWHPFSTDWDVLTVPAQSPPQASETESVGARVHRRHEVARSRSYLSDLRLVREIEELERSRSVSVCQHTVSHEREQVSLTVCDVLADDVCVTHEERWGEMALLGAIASSARGVAIASSARGALEDDEDEEFIWMI